MRYLTERRDRFPKMRFDDLRQFRDVIVRSGEGGRLVRVGDVARLELARGDRANARAAAPSRARAWGSPISATMAWRSAAGW